MKKKEKGATLTIVSDKVGGVDKKVWKLDNSEGTSTATVIGDGHSYVLLNKKEKV